MGVHFAGKEVAGSIVPSNLEVLKTTVEQLETDKITLNKSIVELQYLNTLNTTKIDSLKSKIDAYNSKYAGSSFTEVRTLNDTLTYPADVYQILYGLDSNSAKPYDVNKKLFSYNGKDYCAIAIQEYIQMWPVGYTNYSSTPTTTIY